MNIHSIIIRRQKVKKTICLSTDEWMNKKTVYPHNRMLLRYYNMELNTAKYYTID